MRHVRRLLDERRYPWAHAYVDRLISDSPLDPEPWLLRALILERQGRPNGEAVRRAEELGGDYTTLRNSLPVPRAVRRPWWDGWGMEIVTLLVLGMLVAPLVWLGEPVRAAGPGGWNLAVYLAVILVVYGVPWAVGARRERLNIPAEARARRDASRAFHAGLDDEGLRHHVGGPARYLCLAGVLGALAPGLLPLDDPAAAVRLGAAVLGVAVPATALYVMGAGPLRRAVRVSWVVSVNAALAVVWLAVSLAVPGWDPGAYLLVWGLLGWLAPLLPKLMTRLA
ncbi:hypothetical protein [Nonomuraea sp. NPDC003804]|uniref:hypothetical protein n=1 Tax=Nonomuraea sp. NPDC003804 TaxID=3154547 RepID=UPI0033A1B6DA